jgi:predicted ABC-type ATPase
MHVTTATPSSPVVWSRAAIDIVIGHLPFVRILPAAGGPVGQNPAVATLLVLTGPPGAGKSTVARLLADRAEPSALVEGDAFFGFLARGAIEPWLPASNAQNEVVTRAAAAAAGRFAGDGFFTVFDGMVGPWFLPTFAAETGLARLDYAVLLPSEEVCVHRVDTRPSHGFRDETATRKMHGEFVRAAIDDRHVLRDPPDDPVAVADLVSAALERDVLRVDAARL